jgi:hypothetical protein
VMMRSGRWLSLVKLRPRRPSPPPLPFYFLPFGHFSVEVGARTADPSCGGFTINQIGGTTRRAKAGASPSASRQQEGRTARRSYRNTENRASPHQRIGGHAPQPAEEKQQLFMSQKTTPVRSLVRSIVAWHQSQADVRVGNGAVQRHDAYVNDVNRFGTITKIFEVRGRTKVRRDDEIAGAKRPRDQFDRVAGFQRRAQ